MEKRVWAIIIKRSALELAIIFMAGVAFDYFAEWDTPITTGFVSLAIYAVAWLGMMLVGLVSNVLSMWVISTTEISEGILTDLRSSRIPAPRDDEPKNHTYLGFLMDDDTSDTDARIRAAFLYGGYKPIMSKGIFAGIRMQNAMDAAVLRHYQEAPKRT